MLRLFYAVVAFWLVVVPGLAADRPEGVLWNRSGLPATIPLQLKTSPDLDYLLILRDPQTEEELFAAYVRGGVFFRVLVPPGEFDVGIFAGEAWQSEATLFGAGTREFELGAPLLFRSGLRRRNGHLIDLRHLDSVTVRDLAICQTARLDPNSLRSRRAHAEQTLNRRPGDTSAVAHKDRVARHAVQTQFCD